MLEVDKMLEKCGDFNRQQLIMLLLCCLTSFQSAMHVTTYAILNAVPHHWCADGLGSGPPPQNKSSCHPLYPNSSISDTCSKYNYESYMGFQSFVSEMNWVCNEKWKMELGNNIALAGCVIGNPVMGYLADKLGRVPILVFANVMTILGNFSTIFGMSLGLFCIFRFLMGFVANSNYIIIRIFILEYMRPSLRTVCLNICYGFFYFLGRVISPWIAILTGSWRRFILLEALPIILGPIFFYCVPESVEWLISRQKYDQAIETLRQVAKINGRQIDDRVYKEFIEDCKLKQKNTKTNQNLLHLIAMPRLRRTFLIVLFEILAVSLYNYVVHFNVDYLGVSPFVLVSLSVLPILPACLAVIILQDRIGRKALALCIVVFMSIFILATSVFLSPAPNRSPRSQFTFNVFEGVFGYLSFNANLQYTLELIPTCVRGQALGAFSAMDFIITTFINSDMRKIFLPLPEIILGVLFLLGAGLILLLPETLNRTLPCSLEDGEQLGIDDHWYTFRKSLIARWKHEMEYKMWKIQTYSHCFGVKSSQVM